MKQNILIGLLAGLLTVTIPLRAQIAPRDSDARKGSRLELGRTASTPKVTSPVLPTRRFSLVPNPASTSADRPVALRKNTPINEHYRALLMTRSTTKSTARTSSGDNAPAAAADVRQAPGLEGKVEDRLYANERLWVSNVYPNPADEVAELDYQFNGAGGEAKLVLLNILGAPVAEYELERNDHKVRIGTRHLATGYYLYRLSVDGKNVATKRLLVRHQ
jgi:hypothetical protein